MIFFTTFNSISTRQLETRKHTKIKTPDKLLLLEQSIKLALFEHFMYTFYHQTLASIPEEPYDTTTALIAADFHIPCQDVRELLTLR
jgi:hypothetical protein